VGTGTCEGGRGGVEQPRGQPANGYQQQGEPNPFDFKQTPLSADYFCNNDELQKIFEDLFNDPEDPIDFDRFCNELIDEEFCTADQNLGSTTDSRDTTPSPVAQEAAPVEETYHHPHDGPQPIDGYYADALLPENVLADGGETGVSDAAYGPVTTCYSGVSPSQQVPSPSVYSLSPGSIKEEHYYVDKKFATIMVDHQPTAVWDDLASQDQIYTLIEDGTVAAFDDPFLYEDGFTSETLWENNN